MQLLNPKQGQSIEQLLNTKQAITPVPIFNNYRVIYASIPKPPGESNAIPSKMTSSLEDELSNLSRYHGQLDESYKKEMQLLQNKVSYCFKFHRRFILSYLPSLLSTGFSIVLLKNEIKKWKKNWSN